METGLGRRRLLSLCANEAAAAQAERMREDGEHEWAPPRVEPSRNGRAARCPRNMSGASFAFMM